MYRTLDEADVIMVSTVIWGLTDVLVPGLRAGDSPQAGLQQAAGDLILERLVFEDLRGLYLGEMSEQDFCHRMLDRAGWPIDIEHLRRAIRRKLAQTVPGTADVLQSLSGQYRNVLLADHAREWIDDIRAVHGELMEAFDRTFFSFDLKHTKAEPAALRMMLGLLGNEPAECLLIDADPATVSAAAEIGIEAIAFRDACQLAADLAEREI